MTEIYIRGYERYISGVTRDKYPGLRDIYTAEYIYGVLAKVRANAYTSECIYGVQAKVRANAYTRECIYGVRAKVRANAYMGYVLHEPPLLHTAPAERQKSTGLSMTHVTGPQIF